MKKDSRRYIFIWALVALLVVMIIFTPYSSYNDIELTEQDKKQGEDALKYLEDMRKKGITPPEISDEKLRAEMDSVSLIQTPKDKEGITFFNPISKDYWPSYYYSNFTPAADSSPGVYNKLYQWTPGFNSTSGWSWWIRPGVRFSPYPRARWVRNNGTFYYINNEGNTEPDKRLPQDDYTEEVLKEGYDDINRFRNPDKRAGCCGC